MQNLRIKTTQTVESYLEIPQYFRTNHSHYYKVVSNKTYVAVRFYNTTKEEMESLTVYPEIEVRMIDHLYIFLKNQDIIEITKDEFVDQFDACMAFIDQL